MTILSTNLLEQAQSMLSNPSLFELQEILSVYHQIVQRSNECGHDHSSTNEQNRCQPIELDDDDGDEIIYVETIQSNSTACTLNE